MTESLFADPCFGPEILCPHCHQAIAALTLTDSYLCHRHGAFEAQAATALLVHVQSQRQWRRWEGQWYRQHNHADGIRFEVHEALEKLASQGYRATKIILAPRYRDLVWGESEHSRNPWRDPHNHHQLRLYGLPVVFGGDPRDEPCWAIINFRLEMEPSQGMGYPHFRKFSED